VELRRTHEFLLICCSAVKHIIDVPPSLPSPGNPPGRKIASSPKLDPSVVQVRQVVIDENSAGQRLDNFLIKCLKGVPKTHIYRLIRSGEVRVNKGRAQADTRLEVDQIVRIPPVRVAQRAEPACISSSSARAAAWKIDTVFEDDWFMVLNKPAGVAVHGGSGISLGVIEQLRLLRPECKFLELVHRLDKETSGLLMVAKKRSALLGLQDQLRQRQTGKIYLAMVLGTWPKQHKVIDLMLYKYLTAEGERRVRVVTDATSEGQRSISLVRVLQPFADFSLLEVMIKTGRTHQIRVHLASQGYPIVGDDKYGDFTHNKALARGEVVPQCRFARMFLHAHQLQITHPHSGVGQQFEAPLPPDCQHLVDVLTMRL
jgi:23S rRNA pseudouridine955/2504/2580 synthase